MKQRFALIGGLLSALIFSSCGTGGKTAEAPSTVDSIASLEVRGHQFYSIAAYDSASAIYRRLLDIDPSNKAALRDMGNLHFELAMMMKDETSPARAEHLRSSRKFFTDLERQGDHDADLYDRICQASLALDDNKTFLAYAKKSADRYPFDRQSYNLGIAYFNVGDYQNVINVEKAAIEKFKASPYASSYYRQLGRAYMKVDRDQTAERTFEDGLKIVNDRLRGKATPEDNRRLMEDKIAMLLSLKRLHQTYHKDDKLKEVERQLQEAGYTGK